VKNVIRIMDTRSMELPALTIFSKIVIYLIQLRINVLIATQDMNCQLIFKMDNHRKDSVSKARIIVMSYKLIKVVKNVKQAL